MQSSIDFVSWLCTFLFRFKIRTIRSIRCWQVITWWRLKRCSMSTAIAGRSSSATAATSSMCKTWWWQILMCRTAKRWRLGWWPIRSMAIWNLISGNGCRKIAKTHKWNNRKKLEKQLHKHDSFDIKWKKICNKIIKILNTKTACLMMFKWLAINSIFIEYT